MSEYGKTIGGKLQLKGGLSLKSVKKHKKKKKHKKRDPIGNEDEVSNQEAKEEFKLVKLKGTGRILSSGTTVMGQVGTKFLLELSVGDAIIIQHPTSLVEETRIIKMVLSDISASMSSAFSSDLISSTQFHYIKAPPEEEDTEKTTGDKKRKRTSDEALAFGTYAGGTEVGSTYTYRVKKGSAYGGYTIVKESADTARSREDLLDLRAKKKGDRHCM